jgi:hypothetical protein
VDAFFHDETAKVKAKSELSQSQTQLVKREKISPDPALVPLKPDVLPGTPGFFMLAPLVDQGISYFMTHYAIGLDQPSIASKAYNRYLSTDGFHPLVATTMTALGIAGVANLYMDAALKREATRWYLNAIKMVNTAISSPTDVRKDTTLIAVHLLTMFEATFNKDSFDGWSNHVDGSGLLIKMRGKDQIRTPAGRRMYLHTIGLVTINCMGKGEYMPEYVNELNCEIAEHLDDGDPRTAFFFLHLKTTDLRAQILASTTKDVPEIIDKALELDDTAKKIFENVGPEWDYDTVPCFGDVPGVFGHYYHVYPTHSTAQTWNWVRYNRIYFHDMIRNCILAGFATSPPVLSAAKYGEILASSTQTLQQMQADIIASMPQFLHDTPMTTPRDHTPPFATPPTTPGPPQSPATGAKRFFLNFRNETIDSPAMHDKNAITDRLPVVRVSGGYSTVWALYVAGSMPSASPASQDFVLHCLERIENEFGIMQASVFGKALKLKRSMQNSGEIPLSLCPTYLPPDPRPGVAYDGKVSEAS